MGMQSQQLNPSQVYYDTEQGQYYTVKPPENYGALFPLMRIYGNNTNKYLRDPANRNYLGNPYMLPNRFNTNAQATPYAELTNLFPSLNNNAQSLLAPTDTQSSGASRFLSSNTQSK